MGGSRKVNEPNVEQKKKLFRYQEQTESYGMNHALCFSSHFSLYSNERARSQNFWLWTFDSCNWVLHFDATLVDGNGLRVMKTFLEDKKVSNRLVQSLNFRKSLG